MSQNNIVYTRGTDKNGNPLYYLPSLQNFNLKDGLVELQKTFPTAKLLKVGKEQAIYSVENSIMLPYIVTSYDFKEVIKNSNIIFNSLINN